MLFNILLLIFIIVFIYFIIGIVSTIFARATNPLKKLDYSTKKLFLTFDDGIDPAYTPLLLDLLNQYNIKATFFILASSVENNPEILQRMKKDGHLIGCHSYNHKNQILLSPISLKKDFEKSIKIFKDKGIDIKFYRPPWGHVRPLGIYLAKTNNLKTILWNVIVQDWEKNTTSDILCNKIINKTHGNAVFCLHDGRGKNGAPLKTIGALKIMIPIWKKEGYTFETIDKLFKESIM